MDEIINPEESPNEPKGKTAGAKENARAAIDQATETAQAAWQEAKNKLTELQPLEAYVKEKPIRSVFVALGVGFLLGLFARR